MKHCLKASIFPQRAEINGELCKHDSKAETFLLKSEKKFKYMAKHY